MVTLRQDTRGNFSARKRLPADVREEYGERYGQRFEAKFFAAASKGAAEAAGISERMSDYITGHAHKSAGAGYGAPILSDMAEALKRFPRYEV